FLIFTTFGSLEFHEIQQAVASKFSAGLPDGMGLTITLICLFLFIGCTGKSAQIPLYVWLPDAMAGPTPVSALIHAATMVTSGIYLLARLNFLYSMSDVALMVVAWVGALTALFAATMAIAQTDIKKVLAYSTVSQLGYMFLACGVAGYTAGVFHVITHAFFKALLFLGAGSVIYGMHHEQNILKMGGLKSKMPRTYLVFMIGWLAICGVVPFSGFFSKDEILWLAYSSEHGSIFLWMIGALTAVMTAFYMTRLFSLTFLGQHRGAHDHGDHGHGHAKHGAHDHGDHGHHEVHESPNVMVIPLMVLALLSAIGGFMGIPHASWLEHCLAQVIPAHAHGPMPAMEWVLMGLSLTGAGIGIFLGLKLYSDLKAVERMKQKWASLHKLLENKWYVDEIYNAIIVQPLIAFSKKLWTLFDVGVIDRIVLGFGRISAWTGQQSRVVQTGSLQVYAFVLLLGLFLSLGYMIYGMV
ncbi:MAG: NADH-quinone oxidoreductase subunit L, partial [Bacteriovoracia bacterium]